MLDALDAESDADSSLERRSFRRRYRTEDMRVDVLANNVKVERSLRVPTRNLSRHGLSFLNRPVLTPAQHLEFHIPMPKGQHIVIRGRVARCRYLANMIHEVGAEFTELISKPATDRNDQKEPVYCDDEVLALTPE